MTGVEAYNIATKIAEIAMRNMQFFVAVCTAFGGWTLAGSTIVQLPPFGLGRILIAGIFTVAALGLVFGTYKMMRRLNGAVEVSKDLFRKENGELSKAAEQMHLLGNIPAVIALMLFTIALIDGIILLHSSEKTAVGFL